MLQALLRVLDWKINLDGNSLTGGEQGDLLNPAKNKMRHSTLPPFFSRTSKILLGHQPQLKEAGIVA